MYILSGMQPFRKFCNQGSCHQLANDPTRLPATAGVWDTAGAEQFESLSKMYFHGSKAAAVCFDPCNRASFDKLQFWVSYASALSQSRLRSGELTRVGALQDLSFD